MLAEPAKKTPGAETPPGLLGGGATRPLTPANVLAKSEVVTAMRRLTNVVPLVEKLKDTLLDEDMQVRCCFYGEHRGRGHAGPLLFLWRAPAENIWR